MQRCIRMMAFLLLAMALFADAVHGQSPARDLYGDTLPSGAVARLGTVRFRHDTAIVFAAFLPGDQGVLSVGSDGVLCVWEFPSGKQVRRLEIGAAVRVTHATLSPDGKHLTAFGNDGFMHIWDWARGAELGKVAIVQGGSSRVGPGEFESFDGFAVTRVVNSPAAPDYSRDGKTLMLSTRVLQFVHLPTGKEIGPPQGHTGALTSIGFAPEGSRIITRDAKAAHVWDAATSKDLGPLALVLPPTSGSPTVLSSDGRLGVTVARVRSADAQAARAWDFVFFDTAAGKELGRFAVEQVNTPSGKPIVFSPDARMLAVKTGETQELIALHEVPSGKLLRTLDAGPVAPLPNAPNGKKGAGGFAGGGFGGGGPGGFAGPASRVAGPKLLFAPDGKALAFQAGREAAILVFDTATGKKVGSLPTLADSPTLQGAFSPDGRCLALETTVGTVTLHELASGQPRRTYGTKLPPRTLQDRADLLAELRGGFGGPVRIAGSAFADQSRLALAISPDGKLLALSGPGGSVHLWEVETGKELTVLKGHTLAVSALAFAPDGKTLASASADTTALIWDVTRIVAPVPPARALKAGDLETWWQALAEADAALAYAAMADFATVPDDAVSWIKERVQPAAALDLKRVEEWIAQLDAAQFRVRATAFAELSRLGEPVVPAIDKALLANPPLEARRRLQELHDKLTGTVLQGERLRDYRAVEILERLGTPESRQALEALAKGATGTLITTSAQAALARVRLRTRIN